MSKVMTLKVIDIIDVMWSGSEYNHSNFDRYVVEISALDADRAQMNGYFIKRKDNYLSVSNRPNERLTVYVKHGSDFKYTKDNKIKIKPNVFKLYIHEKNGKSMLKRKYQRALLVEEDS